MHRPEAIAEALEKLRIGKLGTVLLGCDRSKVLITSRRFSLLKFRVARKRTCGYHEREETSPPGFYEPKMEERKRQ
jgi:hypothetical protein